MVSGQQKQGPHYRRPPAWVGGLSFIMFFVLKMTGLLRVSQDIEEMGMDVSKHGGTAYELEGGAASKSSS